MILLTSFVLPAAFSLLPTNMKSLEASRQLLAIGFQESKFNHRVQINGPARGFWQFEKAGGVRGVLSHPATKSIAKHVLKELKYDYSSPEFLEALVYEALEHNDVLAAVFARLLMWTHEDPLPKTQEEGWKQYIETWRPGKPKHKTWITSWANASESL